VNINRKDKCRFSLGELKGLLDAELKGDPGLYVSGIGALDSATPEQLSFLVSARYTDLVAGCKAAALIVSAEFRELECNLLIVKDPYLAAAKAAQLFLDDSGGGLEYMSPLSLARVFYSGKRFRSVSAPTSETIRG
jgi:UDP-3-O-[3-hydroxymyristoyl] glucosamine N-acyltransferase